MLIPTIDLVTLSDIWTTTIQVRLVYHNASLHKTLCVHKVLQISQKLSSIIQNLEINVMFTYVGGLSLLVDCLVSGLSVGGLSVGGLSVGGLSKRGGLSEYFFA